MGKADTASSSGSPGASRSSRSPGSPGSPGAPEIRGGTRARQRKLRAAGKRSVAELTQAGRAMFGEVGYHATRVEEIAARAGLSHGAFYLYFTDKEDFLKALIEDCVQDMFALADRLGPIDGTPEGHQALRVWLGEFVDLYQRHDPVTRAWTEAAHEQGTELARLGQSALTAFAEALAAVVRQHGPPGVDPVIAATALSAMLERFTFLQASRQVRFERDAMLDTLTTLVHLGLTGGTAPPRTTRPGGRRPAQRVAPNTPGA